MSTIGGLIRLGFREERTPQERTKARKRTKEKSQWMAEQLAPLPAMQVGPGLIPGPSRTCDYSVEKVALFCNPASGTRSQALQLRL
jgi:hypothetical protein